MATDATFSAMLNEYLPEQLLRDEMIKRDWLLSNVEIQDGWLTGNNLIVPFVGAQASSVSYGSLTAADDVSDYNYQRGVHSNCPEVWGTLQFKHMDLMRNGKVSEQNFLQILPGQIDDFLNYLKEVVSMAMLSAPWIAKATVSGTAGGVLEVDKPDRFYLGQKVVLIDDDTAQANYYVIAVDVNGGTLGKGSITLSATRGGSAASLAAFTTGANAKVYHPGQLVGGVLTNKLTSLRSVLLSAANGGDASYLGKTKTAFPFLQAVQVNGGAGGLAISASNLIEKLFDSMTEVRVRAKGGKADTFVMSYKNLATAMKLIETQKGGFKVSPKDTKASLYNWTEIQITSVKGEVNLVGTQEMLDSEIYILDKSSMKVHTNGLVKKRVSPDGREFYESRSTAGMSYLVDACFLGDLVVHAPGRNGIIHSISY
jgi:hypothetical protein